MSTSGTTIWSLKRDAVINSALRKLSVLSGGSAPDAYEVTNGAEALNAMIKGFIADGMPAWAIKEFTFTTTANVSSYDIGVGLTLNTPMPLKVVQGFRRESSTGSNIPLNVYTHYDFNLLPTAAASGVPVNLFYQPFSTYGTLRLWPIPTTTTNTVTIVYQRPFEDMNSATDDFDFPPYWTEALIYGLSWRLAGEYGIPINDRNLLFKEAMYFHDQALSFGQEEGSLFLSPAYNYRR